MRTAIGLMGEHGYEGTSTRDIANEAGVTVAALYYHFPSKLDLLREFLHEAHDVVLGRLEREIRAAGDSPRARLDAAVSTLIASNLHDEWAQLAAQVAWREHGRLEDPDRRAIADKRERMIDLIERVIVEGVQAGEFSTSDPRQVAQAVLTLCISVIESFPEQGQNMQTVIELHQRFAVALARTPPGATPARPGKRQTSRKG
jgi:AcrR family transcriptional regulator